MATQETALRVPTLPSSAAVAELSERFARAATNAGVPFDSIDRFVSGGYIPQPKQLEFHAACRECDLPDHPTWVGFGGARGPGKSHATFAQVALDDCQRIPGLKVLYLRKISKNAREQFNDLRLNVLKFVPHFYNHNDGVIKFPNGSRIITGHFKNESDIDQYLGLEYDIIIIEEATTLSLSKFRTLCDSSRTSKPGFRPRIYLTTNPGGVGHAWFKSTFIAPAREGRETDTRFVFATIDDNAFVNPEYKKNLEKNTGWKLKAYRYGDWDIAAGQFFSTWRHDAHVKPKALLDRIPTNAPVWVSFDYGFTHPTSCHLFTEFDGRKRVIDEYYAAKKLPAQNAEGIKEMLRRHGVKVERLREIVAGDDVFAHKGDETGMTIAQQYLKHGLRLSPANMDRINGAGEVLRLLGDVDNGVEPLVEISDRCVKLIECLPTLQHDPHRPEDVLKVDVDEDGQGGDDPYDDFRYGCMAARRPSPPPATAGQRHTANVRMI
jgi:phage terminase large subunit